MLSWFRRRDLAIYPKDEIGDALYAKQPKPETMPEKACLWYDVYFDAEADAEAFRRSCEGRGLAIETDHDPKNVEEGFGAWCVDVEVIEKARHRELSLRHQEMTRTIADFRGRIGGWLLTDAGLEEG